MLPKICITTIEFPPDRGGIGESVHRIAHFAATSAYEVHVVVFCYKQSNHKTKFCRSVVQTSEQENGLIIHRIFPSITTKLINYEQRVFDFYFQLKLLHKKHQFKFFHAFCISLAGFVTTLVAKESNIPIINSVRGGDLHFDIFGAWFSPIIWTLSHSSWVTFVSNSLLKRAILLAPKIKTKSSVILNSCTPFNSINSTEAAKNLVLQKAPSIVLGSLSQFRIKKGTDYLIDSCELLNPDINFVLLLVGDFIENEKQYWNDVIQNSSIRDKIIVTGYLNRTDALNYLPIIDVFLIPSLHEGCPNALIEAMLASKAIVGTNVDAIGEVLEDHVDGILVDPASSEELAHAVKELAHSPELRQKLGMRAKDKALKIFNPETEKAKWLTLYENIISNFYSNK